MIDLYPVEDSVPFIGAFFIGHDDIFVIIEISSSHEDECYDAADRYMTIVISLSIHLKKFGIHSSFHDQSRNAHLVVHGFMEIIILSESRGVKRYIQFFDQFDADETIFTAPNCDHGHVRISEEWRIWTLLISINEVHDVLWRYIVGEEKFSQSLDVKSGPEFLLVF